MTYVAVKPRCADCPHSAEALIGEAQAQYLEHVIEDEDRELERLRVCATCRRFHVRREGGHVYPPECGGAGSDNGLDACRFSPSRWAPFWAEN